MSTAPLSPPVDLSSLSNPNEVIVTHLDWEAKIDFDERILTGTATYTIQCQQDTASTSSTLCLDTSHLIIDSIHLLLKNDVTKKASYTLHDVQKEHLGAKLEIQLQEDAVSKIVIIYHTTTKSSALQWLPKEQTSEKQYPYLFSQCQAIHARTMIPCQDCPGVKMTYNAKMEIPIWSTCVMSALHKETMTTTSSTTKISCWEQPVPISSYLLAFAVGQLVKKDISERCSVWSEPSIVDAAAYEFAQTEDFLKMAEEIAGMPYVWGRYDLLCLPPSFPYGGMENPCLTFVTPTLLAGDRSLADVVAHEIAHSWTGNLVTNATWEHFWLNEGWTTWFQRQIMAKIHNNNAAFVDFDAMGRYTDLIQSVEFMPTEFTSLVPVLGDMDPDDYYSTIPYEKGFHLLFALEKRVGSTTFNQFFQAYLAQYAHKTITSREFQNFFIAYFQPKETGKGVQSVAATNAAITKDAIQSFDWDTWFYKPGMLPEEPKFDRSLAEESESLAKEWLEYDAKIMKGNGDGAVIPNKEDITKDWSSLQMVSFLDAILLATTTTKGKPLEIKTIQVMNHVYKFSSTKNSEILYRYCELAIASKEDPEMILPIIIRFITTQGRMKFVRPLYRSLCNHGHTKLAMETFLQHANFYHPICSKMIATDLGMVSKEESKQNDENNNRRYVMLTTAAVAVVGLAVVASTVVRRGRR